MLRIANLAGVFTGEGFVHKQGRYPTDEDCGFRKGPIDIICSEQTGLIDGIVSTNDAQSIDCDQTYDATGLVATSGFIDSHTHALFAGQRASEFFQRWAGKTYREISDSGGGIHRTVADTSVCPDEELLRSLRERLIAMTATGTTFVEIKSGYANCAAGELRLLRLLKHARNWARPEIRCTFLGLHALPTGRRENEYCSEMIELFPTIAREQLAHHADAFPERGFFSLHESKRFLVAAQECGLAIKVHADEITNLRTSATMIALGARSIDHLEHIDEEAVGLLSRHSTVATLLPATSFFLGIEYANARRLIDSGARVAVATDFNPGSAPATDFQLTNLICGSQLRMSPSEILCAITYNAAAALGLESSHGALCAGRVASLSLWRVLDGRLRDSPTELLAHLVADRIQPSAVFIKGAPCATLKSVLKCG